LALKAKVTKKPLLLAKGKVLSHEEIKTQKRWSLVFNRPEMNFGLRAKVHRSGLSSFSSGV
jgi:hypothetical protein